MMWGPRNPEEIPPDPLEGRAGGVRRVSIAVTNLAAALAFYRDGLGLRVLRDITLPERGVRLVRLEAGPTVIELMESTEPSSAVADFLARRGPGLHHIAVEVGDLELEMRTLLARGFQLLDQEPRDGPEGRIAFVHPASAGGVLIELNELPREKTDEG
jgi:methylmalonyl-CoA epimerase